MMDPSLAHLISWSEATKGDVPPPLTGPSIVISPLPSPHPPTIFLFGGKYVQTRRLTSEMWAMDLSTRVWERVESGDGPGPRYFHSMDVWEDKLVCFGGMSDSDPMSVHNDIWFFDCAARRWLPPPSPAPGLAQDPNMIPSARYAHLSAISRGKLLISGGQHSDNSWIYEINVYDLRRRVWVSKTEQPEAQGLHSKGAYRSVATSSKQRVITPSKGGDLKASSAHSYAIDEEGEGGDIWCYSNYDFAKVRRELDVISPSELTPDSVLSTKHTSAPGFATRDDSMRMQGLSQPPGLRFPSGGIVGNHFILCGLYLASSSAAFSIWSLDLSAMTWRHLEPAVLNTGSWNRAVLWPERARILVFGNAQYDLASDYGRRAVNLDHIAVISLETFGIYPPPKLEIPAKVQEIGLTMLDEKMASDFDVVCDDGRRVKCSRAVLRERWPWFAEQEKDLADKVAGATRDAPALDINDTLLGSFTPARLAPTQLTIPEPFPVCVALVQYFYTLSLSTPLQNRAPVLSALLFLAKQYRIERLAKLVVHALHERLEPSIAVGIYEIATLSGEQNLQVRALNMIHSAKNAVSSRTQRQGPASAQGSEGSQANPQYPAPSSGNGGQGGFDQSAGPVIHPRGGSVDDGTYRRARAESMTLGDETIQAVDDLLAAMEMTDSVEDIHRPESPIDPSPRPTIITKTSDERLPLARPPPLGRMLSYPRTPELISSSSSRGGFGRPSSPTFSEATSHYPTTPAESLRESFILPPREMSYSMDSRSSSSSGKGGLPSLPELAPFDDRLAKRSFAIPPVPKISPSTLEAAGMVPPPPPRSELRLAPVPPTAFTSHQAHLLDSMTSHTLTQQQLPATPRSGVSRAPSLTMSSGSPLVDQRHFSVTTQSSASSDASLRQDLRALVHTPTSMDFTIDYSTAPSITRSDTIMSSQRDTMSISSGSTGTSSKRLEKAEKKAVAAADKAAKKAEQQAKFEALRAEQQRKMAISKAEQQKRAEVAAKAAPAPKPQPKSKFGKLGVKFTESVLFPAGGQNSTMF